MYKRQVLVLMVQITPILELLIQVAVVAVLTMVEVVLTHNQFMATAVQA